VAGFYPQVPLVEFDGLCWMN